MINANQATEPKQYIVCRRFEGLHDEYSAGIMHDRFVATEQPQPGEEIYHGAFIKKRDCHNYGGSPFAERYEYVPVNKGQITHETYMGLGDSSVQIF